MMFRKYQQEVISYALKLFSKGYNNVLIDAPTGFGKSLVNCYIADSFKNAFYVTPQVVLLDQIEKDELLNSRFNIGVVKGRSNYPCAIDRKKNASNAKCITDREFKCDVECEYRLARAKALVSKIACMSFAYLIYDRFVPEEYSFGDRELIVVDEADDLESWAEDFGSFKFRTKNEFKDIYDVIAWAEVVRKEVMDSIRAYELTEKLTDEEVKELEKLRKYYIKLTVFLKKVKENESNWVFEKVEDELIVKPVNVGEILRELVWCRGKKVIASSATIISRELFCKYCGLDLDKTAIIKVPAIFPKENRPVVYKPVARMTKGERANGYDYIADEIVEIADKHVGERGLIHAHSYEIAKEVYKRLRLFRPVFIHDRDDRREVFNEFLNTEGAVFVSVGFNRGIDLKYDMCRWQVIVKVPFPDQADIRVRELWVNRKAWNWARYQAIKNLVQACGRIVRAEDDYGVTYILDRSFGDLFKYKSQFPKWFVESVEVVE